MGLCISDVITRRDLLGAQIQPDLEWAMDTHMKTHIRALSIRAEMKQPTQGSERQLL